jgi:hypothetical protein
MESGANELVSTWSQCWISIQWLWMLVGAIKGIMIIELNNLHMIFLFIIEGVVMVVQATQWTVLMRKSDK